MAQVLNVKELRNLAMFVTAFDTLKLVKRLIGIGVPPTQAEAGAELLAEIFNSNLGELATKEDLQREINGLRKDGDFKHDLLHKDMESLRKDMDVKHETLPKDMDTPYETLRKDMHLMAERFHSELEKLGRKLTISHGLIIAAIISAASALNKFF